VASTVKRRVGEIGLLVLSLPLMALYVISWKLHEWAGQRFD
jgi:hypothetical protein